MDDERKLIERCRAGDLAAFRPLVERHEDRIYSLARSMLGDEEAAKDAAQEAFIRAFRSLDRFQGSASFFTWLYRIATNVCLNSIRGQSTRADRISLDDMSRADEVPPDALFTDDPGQSDFERLELRERIDALLARLTPEHRAVIILKDLEGRTQEEIADLLDLSIGTLKSRLSRARANLKRLMQPLYDEWTEKHTEDPERDL